MHEFFKIASTGKNDWWRYVVVFLIAFGAHVLGQMPVTGLLMYKAYGPDAPSASQFEIMERIQALDFEFFGISQNVAFGWLLFSFFCGFIALMLVTKPLHKRPFKTLITPFKKIRKGRLAFGFFVWLGLAAIGEGYAFFTEPENYIWTFNLGKFIPLLLLCLILLPFQTSFEELIFRGHMLQGLTRWMKYPIYPLIITSVLFGLMHGANPEIFEFGFGKMMVFYIGTGLFLGLITVLDEGLELALGVHFANNLFGALFVSFDGSALQTPTMWRMKELSTDYMLVGWFAFVAIFMILATLVFKWKNWGKIFKKVEFEDLHPVEDYVKFDPPSPEDILDDKV